MVCPLTDRWISFTECMENRETREESIPDEFKVKPNWKEICKNCEYSKY